MLDLIRKSFEAALGAASVTQEKLKELADELVVRGHLTKKEGSDLLKELKETAKDSRKKLTSLVDEQVRKVIKEMGVATTSEIKALEGKIAKLEAKLEEKKEKKKTAAKSVKKDKS